MIRSSRRKIYFLKFQNNSVLNFLRSVRSHRIQFKVNGIINYQRICSSSRHPLITTKNIICSFHPTGIFRPHFSPGRLKQNLGNILNVFFLKWRRKMSSLQKAFYETSPKKPRIPRLGTSFKFDLGKFKL
jgi:hypothetical protein